MAGEMEPAEEMDQTEPDSTVEGGGGSPAGGEGAVGEAPEQEAEGAVVAEAEEQEDDDEARSEATFRFRVDNFSSIKDSSLSECCIIRWIDAMVQDCRLVQWCNGAMVQDCRLVQW